MLIETETDLDELARAAKAHAVIAAWAGAGVFEALRDGGPRTLASLPGDPRALARTAPLLVHLGLLVGDGETVALSRTAQALLQSGALRLAGSDAILGDLSRLDEVIRTGGPVRAADGTSRVTEGGVREHEPENARRFLEMLYRRSAQSADEVARWVVPRLPAGAHVLDLGGGHGRYGHVLRERGLTVTLFDRSLCVELARERFGDALQYRAGDFTTDALGGPYAAALLSNIVHGLGPDECRAVLTHVREALAPGGLVIIKDMILGEHGAHPAEAVYFDVTMLMYTRQGRSYRVGELADLLGETGFAAPEHLYVSNEGYSLLMARRT